MKNKNNSPRIKRCSRCKIKKPVSEFRMRCNQNSLRGWCIKCEREYQRDKAKNYKPNKNKFNAKEELRKYALRAGIKLKFCCNCSSSENVDMHHYDYSNPFLFIPLCKKCHGKLHSEERKNGK